MADPAGKLELGPVAAEKPEELNLVLGQSHAIRAGEDLYK